MPNTLIATRAGWITEPGAVIDAVQSALREALKIPEGDRTLRLIEHPPSHFAVPPGRGEKFTLIEVTMFSGRSMSAKRALISRRSSEDGCLPHRILHRSL
jgi:hypothetical protein